MLIKSLVLSVLFILALFIPMRSGSSAGNVDERRANDKLDAPMEVDLYFSSQPSLQQQTVLNFEVTALQDAPNTEIKIEVPQAGFRLISGIVNRVENLAKGETKVYQIVVLPIGEGSYYLSATAISTNGSYVFGKRAELFVQLDTAKSKVSKANILAGEPTTNSQAEKISDNSEPPPLEIPDQKSPLKDQSLEVSAPGPGQIVVRGYWFYRDKNGIDRPLRDARVEIWDLDTFSGDDLLHTGRANNSGFYESPSLTNSGDEAGGQDIYVRVYSTDDISVRVTNFSNGFYTSQSSTFSNVADGYVEVGGLSVIDANNRMAFYIYDKIANDAYDYLSNTVGWTNSYNQQVRWSPTSTSGALYNHGGTIDLNAGDRWDIDVFLHEYGHFVMWKIYGNSMPSTPNCSPHSWGLHSSTGCAWVEGWATFLQAAIQNDRYYDDTENQILHIDIEPPNPGAHHAEDEGAVTASLWDIFDSSSETWESVSLGINGTWGIASSNRPSDFIGFYVNWMNGSNGSNSPVASIIQHHDVIPNPVLTASLTFTPGQPYVVGQTVTGRFSITNRGNRSITFEVLTIGGRLNTDSNVIDFPWDTNITIGPNQTYQYSRTFTFQQSGSYKFFPAYRLQGNVWKIGQLSEIPKDAGVVDLLSFTVNPSCNAPSTFSLSAPSNGQSLSPTTSVTLSWGGSANADSYDVYFGTSSNPPFIANQTGTSRSVSVTPGQTYWWKIVARVNCGSATSTAGIWSFSVQQTCNTPGAFSLSAPSNGQSLSPTTSVTLSWGGSANADSYDVYFGTSSNPPFIANQTGTSRSVSVTPGQTYWWKIVARVNCGSATSTAGIWSFSVQQTCNTPGAFSLSAPSNGQSLSPTTSVTLSWGGSANADSYDVYFGTSSNPPFIANQTGTSRSVSVTPGQTYWWKIVARVNCGSATSTAGIWSFSVQQTCNTPGAFSLSAPSNGQSLSSTTSVTLSWGGSANADSYDVYFGTSSNPPFIANQTGTSRSVSVTPGQTYWWKIVARVNCGSATSTAGIWSFSVQQTTDGNAIYDPSLKAPKCGQPGNACHSGALLIGRDTLADGPELNQPNTINNSCPDGTGGNYHVDESIDVIRVSTLDGGNFVPGKMVKIEVTVWAWADPTQDHLDLYYAADASNPNWIYLATLEPSTPGAQVLSTTYALPNGANLQAVRAIWRYQGNASPCGSNSSFDDYDDLLFAVTEISLLRIDSITTLAGRTSGGQPIVLTGAFSGLSTVTIGGVAASWFYTNGSADTSRITVTTPAHSVGAVQFNLTPTSGSAYSKSNAFAYLPTVFTNNTLFAAVTTAKAQHIIELRQAIDAMRAVAGLAPAPWTDPTLSPFSMNIKGVHILELRTYLNDAASRLGYSTSSYTDPTLTTGFLIKRIHIEELRQRIRNIAG